MYLWYINNQKDRNRNRELTKSNGDQKMTRIEKVNGVTAKLEVEKGAKRNHLQSYDSLEKLVAYMTRNDVIHKGANIGEDFYIVDLEKTDEANENWYENEMRIKNKHFPKPYLPTDMYK